MRSLGLLLLVGCLAEMALAHGGAFRPPPRGRPGDPFSPRGGGPTTATPTAGSTTNWEVWWSHNRERYIRLRERVAARTVVTGRTKADDGDVFDRTRFREQVLVPFMIEALKDRDEEVRTSAAVALGKFRARAAIPLLQQLQVKDKNKGVREACLVGLLLMRDPTLADYFRKLVLDERQERRSRGVATVALGFLKDVEFLERIFRGEEKKVRSGAEKEIRTAAAFALGLTKSVTAAPPLSAELTAKHPKAPKPALGYAPCSLSRLKVPTALGEVVSLLRSRKADRWTRYGAAIATGDLVRRGDNKTLEFLGQKVRGDRDWSVRVLVAMSLGRIGGDLPFELILDGHAKSDSMTRGFFYLAAGLTKHEEAEEFLLRELKEGANAKDRAACALGLALGGFKGSIPTLRKALKNDRNRHFGPHAMIALGLLNDKESIPIIRKLLKENRDPAYRMEGAIALALLRGPAAMPDLVKLMTDAKALYTRSAVVQALGLVGTDKAFEPLAKIVRDRRRQGLERALALSALGRIGDGEKIPVLVRMAFDLNYYVPSEAVNELVTIL